MTLKERYDALCDDYAKAMMKKWNEKDKGYWFQKISGGLWVFGSNGSVFSFYEIKIIIDQDISREEYEEWEEYVSLCAKIGMKRVNLENYRSVKNIIPLDDLKVLANKKDMLKESIDEGV